MSFDGFTLPDGAWLPPELIYLLPRLSEAKLKITLAVLYNELQVGGSETSSLTDLQHLTGLSRPSVATAALDLVAEEILYREQVGHSFVYRLNVKNFYYRESQLRESESKLNTKDSLTDSLNLTTNCMRSAEGDAQTSKKSLQLDESTSKKFLLLLKKLRAAGVYLKTAQAIVAEHDEEYILRHLDYYRYALGERLANGPGYLVSSLKEDWQAPLGYKPAKDDPSRYINGPYADFIEH